MSARERRKGRQFEQEVARRMSHYYDCAERGLQDRDGHGAPDVEGTPWWVEAKHRRRVMPKSALEQAESHSDGRPALCVLREHGSGDGNELVVMRWETFRALLGGEV